MFEESLLPVAGRTSRAQGCVRPPAATPLWRLSPASADFSSPWFYRTVPIFRFFGHMVERNAKDCELWERECEWGRERGREREREREGEGGSLSALQLAVSKPHWELERADPLLCLWPWYPRRFPCSPTPPFLLSFPRELIFLPANILSHFQF